MFSKKGKDLRYIGSFLHPSYSIQNDCFKCNLHYVYLKINPVNLIKANLFLEGSLKEFVVFYMQGKDQKRRQYKTGKSLPQSGYLLRY